MKQFDFSQSNEDKKTEFLRYEQRAKSLSKTKQVHSNSLGSKSQKLCLRSPYLKYEEIIKGLNLNINHKVLELACGTGEFSNLLVDSNCDLRCTDISKESLIVLKNKYLNNKQVNYDVVDIEDLPYEECTFDFVFIAGGMSYGDNNAVLKEIHKVLKIGGQLIAIDSLNHNLLYKLNRWRHFLKGNRSISTIRRMPKIQLINSYIKLFGEGKVFYFGGFSWFFIILSSVFEFNKVNIVSNWLDNFFCVKKLAFKFVLIVKKNE